MDRIDRPQPEPTPAPARIGTPAEQSQHRPPPPRPTLRATLPPATVADCEEDFLRGGEYRRAFDRTARRQYPR